MKFITKKMIFSFSFVLLVQISSAFVGISQHGVSIYYNITSTNLCHSKAGRFSVKQGLSVTQCVEECGLRKYCAALSYKKRNNFCELFLFTDDVNLKRGGCIFIKASDLVVTEMPCGDCAYGEMCDPVLKACVQKECLNTTATSKGKTLGNRYGVGDMLKYECTRGYRERNDVVNTVCLETGSWNASADCVMDCENPPYIQNGRVTSVGINSARVTCTLGYMSAKVMIHCTNSGSWDVTCDPIDCGDPPAITNGIAALDTIDGTYYLNTSTVTCSIGYRSVVTTIVCTEDGSWTTVTCYPIVCGNLPAVVKGTAVLDKANGVFYLDTATVTCDDWYQIESNKIECTSAGTWESASCIDCYSAAPQEYIGRTDITWSGIQCQRWDSQFPHNHNHTDLQYYPDATLAAANNYCRTPEPGNYDPWCLTMNIDVEWDFCNVPKCRWT